MIEGARRCSHNPRAPRLLPLAELRSTHDLVRAALAQLEQLYDKRGDAEISAPLRRRQKGRKAKGNVIRAVVPVSQLRSQRCEADTLILSTWVDGCNVETGEVGRWREGQLEERWSLEDLEKRTGLTSDRLERAISDLCAGNPGERLAYRWQGRDREGDGDTAKWSGHVAVTKLTRAFWEWLGLGGRRDVILAERKAERRKAEVKAERKEAPRPAPTFDPELARLEFVIAAERPDLDGDAAAIRALALERLGRPPPG